jgi:thiosulfate/3-mercaptopyruvate sulfurtransferase
VGSVAKLSAQSLVNAGEVLQEPDVVIIDCRFSLADSEAGRALYFEGHIPGAHYLSLSEDLSGPVKERGGRHPLPQPERFAGRLADLGIDKNTAVIAYDDSRFAFAARLWWMMKNLGYTPPRLLDGGYKGFLDAGGVASLEVVARQPCAAPEVGSYSGICTIEGLRLAQQEGAVLVDSREEARYAGREEPIDPVAGHIPGAINRPWQSVTDDSGRMLDLAVQQTHWADVADEPLVVYCGSGVTACVNLFSLALLGQDEAVLYAGSWSDWCSYL